MFSLLEICDGSADLLYSDNILAERTWIELSRVVLRRTWITASTHRESTSMARKVQGLREGCTSLGRELRSWSESVRRRRRLRLRPRPLLHMYVCLEPVLHTIHCILCVESPAATTLIGGSHCARGCVVAIAIVIRPARCQHLSYRV